jgi:Carboxypeptidase regulatory-like domain
MPKLGRSIWFVIVNFALTLLCACTFGLSQTSSANQVSAANTRFKIAGTVVNSITGAPLGKARITLVDTANRANMLSVITGDGGHFEFYSLYRAKYSLQGAKRGFISAGYEQHEEFSTAIVTGGDFNTENLVLQLTPLALLGGKVLDETGEPVRKANVRLFIDNQQGGRRRTVPVGEDTTDDQGYYEFNELAPANYFLAVSAKPWYAIPSFSSPRNGSLSSPNFSSSLDVAYPTTYNNGATDSQSATPISIQAGDHVQVDMHLSPVPVLHLIFRIPQAEQQGVSMPAFETRVFDSREYLQVEWMQSPGTGVYEIAEIPAGKYTVRLMDPRSGQAQLSTEMNLTTNGQELDLTQGEPSASVKLSFKMPRQAIPTQQVNIALLDFHRQVVGFQAINATGEVEFDNIPAGKYSILVFSQNNRYSVARIVSGGVETLGHDLSVAPGASLSGTVFLALGVVAVEGFVHRGGKPSSGVMVALIPKDPQSHLDMFRRDQSDSDGSFALPAVIPGTYTLIAVEDAWGFQWMQPDVLNRYLQHGQNLTIGELMTNTVHLPDPVEVQPH